LKYINFLILLSTSLLLLACSPDNTPKPKLFEEQRNALDQAKEIDGKVQQQTQDMQKNLDKQTQ